MGETEETMTVATESRILEFCARHADVIDRYCVRTRIPAGTTLFEEGEDGDAAYILEQGEAVVSRIVGGREKAIAVAGRGDILGEIAPFSGNARTATARTNRGVHAIRIDRASLERMKAEHPDLVIALYEEILRVVTSRLRGSIDRYEVIYHLLK